MSRNLKGIVIFDVVDGMTEARQEDLLMIYDNGDVDVTCSNKDTKIDEFSWRCNATDVDGITKAYIANVEGLGDGITLKCKTLV